MFSNEDVTIGAWMLSMNVRHENSRTLCEPDCTETSVAVWDIPRTLNITLIRRTLPSGESATGATSEGELLERRQL